MGTDGLPPREVEPALLRALADSLPAMLAYWDADQRCRFANRAYEKWFGVAPDSLIGRHMKELLGPIYPLNLPYIEGALRGEEQQFEREIPDPNGGPPRFSQAHYIPDIRDGETRGFSVLVVDITRRRQSEDTVLRLERQLQATERLTAMATLAGGIAHEINNPLAAVLANLELALERLHRDGAQPVPIEDVVVEARDSAQRVAAVVRSLRLLARGDTSSRQLVDVSDALAGALGVVSNVVRFRARIVHDLADVGVVEANAALLGQVFVSLLLNAVQALPEEDAARNLIQVTARREGAEVVVDIADNGSGVPAALQSRIFEPFFTTKDVGSGMGLGLSVAKGILDAFGGTISVRSEVGEGSVFSVRLPAAPGPSRAEQARPSSMPVARKEMATAAAVLPRVLVVDDEPNLGKSLRLLLSRDFEVTVVNGGRDAIEALCGSPHSRRSEREYDVILCDLMMPDVSGADVYAEATRARPELADRFVFMTGGAFTARGREFLAGVSAPVIDKPFDAARVREVITAQAKRSQT